MRGRGNLLGRKKKNVDAAVQGFLQSRLFPQIPARSAGPPLVPMAIKSLGGGLWAQGDSRALAGKQQHAATC